MQRRCYVLLLSTLLLSLGLFTGTAQGQNAAVTVRVDASLNRHAINPNIYGTAYGSTATLSDLNVGLNRYGGNNTSRYNWLLNADNRGSDYFFESVGEDSAVPGERGDTIISQSKAANAQAMLTVPLIGWVAKLGPARDKLASFSIQKYGPQTNADFQQFPDAGNGVLKSTGQNVLGNDPNDANIPSDSTFQNAWIQHLVQTWGTAANGGLKYYVMDNEPSIWHGTHRDVHPIGATMAEIRDKILDYGGKVKANDGSALVVGPEEWGWSGYFYSGFDQQYGNQHGWSALPDRNANGGADYLPWLLDQLRQNNAATGKRILDVFSVHYYPQSGEFSDDVSASMQLLRNESTRALWDPNYADRSWIGTQVQLIPRLKQWVNSYYPGTQTAITEYNWGAEGHINGATTQADIWGIFGREGLDMGSRWATPDPSTPTYKAMKLYRNYDGALSTFGDTSVSAVAPNPDNVSAFASQRTSDGALTVMVISKTLSGTTPVTVSLANFKAKGAAQTWQLTSANAITHLADTVVSGNALSFSAPAQSITLFVIPPAPALQSSAVFVQTDGATQGNWQGVYGADGYRVLGDTTSLPSYAGLNASGQSNWTWAGSTSDTRALQKGGTATDRIASCDYSGASFRYDLNLTDGQAHQVAFYCLDWDTLGRSQTIQIYDAATNTLLDSQSVSAFVGGKYLVWNITGHVRIDITNAGALNAVLSGIFFAPATTIQIPPAPANFKATAGSQIIALTWDTASGAVTYNLYRSLTAGGEGSTPVKTGLTSAGFNDTGLTNGTTYFYKVSAVNMAGESAKSSEASAIPDLPAAGTAIYQINSGGGAVAPFSADGNSTGGSTVAYSFTPDLSGVTNPAPASVYNSVRYGASFGYSLTGLTPGGSYKLRLHFCEVWSPSVGLRSFNVAANGANVLSNFDPGTAAGGAFKASVKEFTVTADTSGTVSITVNSNPNAQDYNATLNGLELLTAGPPTIPAAPTGLTATAGNTQVTLAWNAVSGAVTYNLYRSLTAGGEGSTPVKTGLTSAGFNDTGLTNGTTYFYKVSAVNMAGESAKSSEASAAPSATAGQPSAVFVKADASTQGNWQGVYGADGYRLAGDTTSLPAYAGLSVSGQSAWTWAGSTSDARALQKGKTPTDRIASCEYASNRFSYDMNLTDGQSHQVAFYCLDWDTLGRSQTIQIFDAATNTLLDSQSVSAFVGGKYLVWNITGHVRIDITNAGALNAVLSGVFFR